MLYQQRLLLNKILGMGTKGYLRTFTGFNTKLGFNFFLDQNTASAGVESHYWSNNN